MTGRKSRWWPPSVVAVLVAGVFAVLAGSLLWRSPQLIRQATKNSCAAFVGWSSPHERILSPGDGSLAVASKQTELPAAMHDSGLPQPVAPYVRVFSTGGELDFRSILIAEKRNGRWTVESANERFDRSTRGKTPLTRRPATTLSAIESEQLDQNLSADCLYREPKHFNSNSARLLGLFGDRMMCFDGSSTLIEVNDGQRQHAVVQQEGCNELVGRTGSAARLIKAAASRP